MIGRRRESERKTHTIVEDVWNIKTREKTREGREGEKGEGGD